VRYVKGRVTANKPLYVETPLWDDAEPHRPSLCVDDHEAVETGLLWADGEPVMRLPNPIGFGRDSDW